MPSRQPISQNPNPTPKVPIFFITIVSISSVFIVSAILYFIYYLYFSLIKHSRTNPFDSSPNLLSNLQRFSFKELKSATNGFTESNSIGKGGSGAVFRGILHDGKLVAVKVLDTSSPLAEREFQNELQILGNLSLKSPRIVSLLGFCVEKGNRLLVYEYMPNRSLQEYIFSEKLCLDWGNRFEIIKDISTALEFLHTQCDPPVIHGDVKPSNVLLDLEFKAKLSDFGLSRWKIEGEFGVDLFSQELGKSQELSGNLGASGVVTPFESVGEEVDFAVALQASSSSKTTKMSPNLKSLNSSPRFCNKNENGGNEVKGKEVSALENGVIYDDELFPSVEHSMELNLGDCEKKWGKDWWWKQDGNDELCSTDYVREWIGSQISPSGNSEWDEKKKCFSRNTTSHNSIQFDKVKNNAEMRFGENKSESPKVYIENEELMKWKKNKKHMKMEEWWKEEQLDEIKKKSNKLMRLRNKCKKGFNLRRFQFKRRKFREQNHDEKDPNGEFSFRKGWRSKNDHSPISEMWSGDLLSRELSSTTSMRGTLCYVAPEYGGCGYLMEKADIYSFGVLILVIISGRRPLHVLSSPMKLEKANLIGWCRQLSQSGNVLELVDEKLKEQYNKEQASLCINLALACLQKMPELRPDIGDIVKILKGEMSLSSFPFEFSPSPPSKTYNKSRRKQKGNNLDKF